MDNTPPHPTPDLDPPDPSSAWDPRAVMRERAAATRKDRDAAIDDLRHDLGDEEILGQYGINLDQIER